MVVHPRIERSSITSTLICNLISARGMSANSMFVLFLAVHWEILQSV